MIDKNLEKTIYAEFGKVLGNEILLKILVGYTVDNAIQTVLEGRADYERVSDYETRTD